MNFKLAIEIDGRSHDYSQTSAKDLERQNELEERGIRFLRFEEREVRNNNEQVVKIIEDWIDLNT